MTHPVSITRIRVYVSNGAVLNLCERLVKSITMTKSEAEQYRRDLTTKYKQDHPDAEVHVDFDTKATEWVKLK